MSRRDPKVQVQVQFDIVDAILSYCPDRLHTLLVSAGPPNILSIPTFDKEVIRVLKGRLAGSGIGSEEIVAISH